MGDLPVVSAHMLLMTITLTSVLHFLVILLHIYLIYFHGWIYIFKYRGQKKKV